MEKLWELLSGFMKKVGGVLSKIHLLLWGLLVVFVFGIVPFIGTDKVINVLKSFELDLQKMKQQPSSSPLTQSQITITTTSLSTAMKIESVAFQNNQPIPPKYTCDGKGMSPPLQISEVPAEAKSLALIVHDPDAPVAGGFTHWVMWNIPAQTAAFEEDAVPKGAVEGRNGGGSNGWTGPCPPSGTHHYQFILYALDSMLDIPAGTDKAGLEKAMEGHILSQETLVGLYQKK